MIVMLYFTYHPNTVGTLYLCVCAFVCSVFLALQRGFVYSFGGEGKLSPFRQW